jgi:hypothetical protein
MKVVVTHKACDLDAVASTWIIKRFLPGWENSETRFVPAGTKLAGKYIKTGDIIEKVAFDNGNEAEVIHVDTGLTPLDHHQTRDDNTCATSLSFEYVLSKNGSLSKDENKKKALSKIVDFVIDDDHFQEVFYQDPTNDIYDFTVVGLIHGIKLLYPKDDTSCLAFGMDVMDAVYHYFENKVWAEEEIKDKGIEFNTRWGKALAVESLNDTVLKLGQSQGFVITVRKDPSTGNVRIKARPKRRSGKKYSNGVFEDVDVDLTSIYNKLKKMDPDATWFLHVSGRMLLNGSSKNPEMKGSNLTLSEVVEVLQND